MLNLALVGKATFPESRGISINMMPYVIGDVESIPEEYRQYVPMIEACGVEKEENRKIGYLTILESDVKAGVSQRRPGVHTDGHCCKNGDKKAWGGWGSGKMLGDGTLHVKGIYVASNIPDTCQAWDKAIDNSGWMGDCEGCPDIMKELGETPAVMMGADRIYWMTDRCPHESLPVKEDCHRQFFRLVTSAVDIWYTRHSTPNRLGVKAPCQHVDADKFVMVEAA
jgi:hypothetical protein